MKAPTQCSVWKLEIAGMPTAYRCDYKYDGNAYSHSETSPIALEKWMVCEFGARFARKKIVDASEQDKNFWRP